MKKRWSVSAARVEQSFPHFLRVKNFIRGPAPSPLSRPLQETGKLGGGGGRDRHGGTRRFITEAAGHKIDKTWEETESGGQCYSPLAELLCLTLSMLSLFWGNLAGGK